MASIPSTDAQQGPTRGSPPTGRTTVPLSSSATVTLISSSTPDPGSSSSAFSSSDPLISSSTPDPGSSSSAAFSSSDPLSSSPAFFSSPFASNISSASKASASSPSPSNTTSPSVVDKKKNPAGPVAGGLVAALLVLAALVFFLFRVRRRHRNLALSDKENSHATSAPYPFPVDPTPNEATPAQRFSTLPSGETRLSPPTQVVPRGTLAADKKARHTARLEQEIRALTEQAEARGGTDSVAETSGSPKPDQANAQLLEEMRMLRTQMSAIQQQMQMQAVMDQGLPEYTADPS